jgi:4-amino-4-deoxy-L-arabinose transferase-like glycosyltransferase
MRKTLLFASIIFIVGFFFRLHNITTTPPGLYPDEAMNGNNALEAIRTGEYKLYYPENNGREGLFINIQALFIQMLGNEPWALRMAAALFGAGTVLGIYFLAFELFAEADVKRRRRIAAAAGFFAATGVWAILLSRLGFRANMAPFFLTWSIFLLLYALRKLRTHPLTFASVFSLISSGLLFGLGFHSYIAYRIAPLIALVPMIAALVRQNGPERKRVLAASAAFIVAAVIAFAPLGLYYIANPQDFFGRTSQISVFSSQQPIYDLALNVVKTLGMFNVVGDWNWRHNYAGAPLLFWPVGIMFILGVGLCIKNLWNARSQWTRTLEKPEALIFTWFFVMLLPVVISNEGIPHALRAIVVIPPVFILCGVGAAFILERIKIRFSPFLYVLTIAVFSLLFVYQAYYRYFIQWGQNPNVFDAYSGRYVEIGRQLLFAPADINKYVVVNANGTDVRGIPMPAQTVMFITDTFSPARQQEKKIFYVPDRDAIPESITKKIVVPLESE